MARIGGVGKALVVLLAIMLPLQAIVVVANIGVVAGARDFLDGRMSSSDFGDLRAVSGLGALPSLLTVPIAVMTMIWMWRMAGNLRVLGRTGQRWSPGWAIGGWFTPPCIYVVPWLMFGELWRGSDPQVPPHDPSWRQQPNSRLVHAWWVLYGLAPLLGAVGATNSIWRFTGTGTRTDREIAQDLVDTGTMTTLMAVVSFAATIVYLLLVRRLTARHMRCTGER